MKKSLITEHSKQTAHYDRHGGDGAYIDTLIHYDHLGRGKVDVVVERKQDYSEVAVQNAIKRGMEQQGWDKGLGRQIADVPLIVVELWKEHHGFDLRKANLNDPVQKETFHRLINSAEWRWVKTFEARK